MTRPAAALLLGFALLGTIRPVSRAWAQVCGDWDCNNRLSGSDTYYIYNALAEGWVTSCVDVDNVDADGHYNTSLRDAVFIYQRFFFGQPDLTCPPTLPELSTEPSEDFFLACTGSVPANVSRCTLYIDLIYHRKVLGALVGVKMLIGGDTLPAWADVYFHVYDAVSGRAPWHSGLYSFGFSAQPSVFHSAAGRQRVAWLDMTLPPSPVERPVTIELVNFDTLFDVPKVNQSTSVLDEDYVMRELHTVWDACPVRVTGDGDMNSVLTAGDIVLLVNYVFKSGYPPNPCAITGDVNCDLQVTSSDVISLVNHVFKGGPEPCDACSVRTGPWGCL